jgi:GxxExxY protein
MTRELPDDQTAHNRAPPDLIDKELTGIVIGAFYTVYNRLGFGFLESVYARALAIVLRRLGLRVEREVPVAVYFEDEIVGRFRIDMLVERRLVLEIKAGRSLAPTDRNQLLNCLRSSNLELGLLLHFGPRPAFKRVVAENHKRMNPAVPASSAESSF